MGEANTRGWGMRVKIGFFITTLWQGASHTDLQCLCNISVENSNISLLESSAGWRLNSSSRWEMRSVSVQYVIMNRNRSASKHLNPQPVSAGTQYADAVPRMTFFSYVFGRSQWRAANRNRNVSCSINTNHLLSLWLCLYERAIRFYQQRRLQGSESCRAGTPHPEMRSCNRKDNRRVVNCHAGKLGGYWPATVAKCLDRFKVLYTFQFWYIQNPKCSQSNPNRHNFQMFSYITTLWNTPKNKTGLLV